MDRLIRNGFIPWDIARHIRINTWLVKQQFANIPCKEYCARAIWDKLPECLIYAIQKKCPWSKHAFKAAEETGSIFCLWYAQSNAIGFKWTYLASQVDTPSLEYLLYAMSAGARRDATLWIYFYATLRGRGCLDQLCWASMNGIECDDRSLHNCMNSDRLECFAFIHCHACSFDYLFDTLSAAEMDAVAIFVYIYKHGGGFPIHREDLESPSGSYTICLWRKYLSEWMQRKE